MEGDIDIREIRQKWMVDMQEFYSDNLLNKAVLKLLKNEEELGIKIENELSKHTKKADISYGEEQFSFITFALYLNDDSIYSLIQKTHHGKQRYDKDYTSRWSY